MAGDDLEHIVTSRRMTKHVVLATRLSKNLFFFLNLCANETIDLMNLLKVRCIDVHSIQITKENYQKVEQVSS